MKYVRVGRTGLKASIIGLGTGQFGTPAWGFGKNYDEAMLTKVVQRAVELGVNFFDTAETYGNGLSEKILGRALKGYKRDEYIIATKVAPWNLTPPRMNSAARRSLERLQMKMIDLYLIHYPSPLTPLKEVARGLDSVVRNGAATYVGVSNFSPLQIQCLRRHLRTGIAANEIEYNFISRQSEKRTIPFCLRNDIGVIAYSPLAGGVLSQQFLFEPSRDRARAFNFHARRTYLKHSKPAFDALRKVSAARDATMAQVALAWLAGSGRIVAVPAALTVQQVEQNAASSEISLSAGELALLRRSFTGEQLFTYGFDHFLVRPLSWARAALTHM